MSYKPKTIYISHNGVTKKFWEEEYVPCTWTDGTDEEIIEALDKHYAGEINLHDYWSVGDERVVSLSAITDTTYSAETQEAQDVIFVLVNAGGKTLVTPINEVSECAFIVGQKECLSTAGMMQKSSSSTVTSGWSSSGRRSWCNNTYRNAIPESIRSIFKQHYNYLANSYSSTAYTSTSDYFCLPSAKEIYGIGAVATASGNYANADAESLNAQLEYYKASSTRIKHRGTNTSDYWTSSKNYYTDSTTSSRRRFEYINTAGTVSAIVQTAAYGIAPQGVI